MHCLNPGDLRNAIPNVPLDGMMERHRTAGATVACAVKSHIDGTVTEDVDQFDIATIRLHGGTDQIDNLLHAIPEITAESGRS
jgi:hypothetical protein